MAVRDGGDDEFVGAGDALQCLQLFGDHIGITDELGCGAVLHDFALLVGQRLGGVGIRVGSGAAARADGVHPVAVAGGEVSGGGGVVGHHHVGGDHHVRLGQRRRRCEGVPVGLDRVEGGGWGDVVAGHERQPVGACHLRALPLAAAEHPRRQAGSLAWHGVHVVVVDLVAAVQHGEDVVDLIGEIRGDRFGLLQHRHLRTQPVGDDGAHVERRRHDHTVDVAPFRWQLCASAWACDGFLAASRRR